MKFQLFLIVLFLAPATLKAQTDFIQTRRDLTNIRRNPDSQEGVILTQRGINIFFARRVASYLSGSNDLSLYKNYFVSDISDGVLFFGHNFIVNRNENDRVQNILTFGAKAKSKDKLSNLYSAGKFAGDIGLDLKFTHIFSGSVSFDRSSQIQLLDMGPKPVTQQSRMKTTRQIIYGKLVTQMKKDSSDFFSSIVDLADGPEKQTMITAFIAKQDQAYKKSFAEMEADEFEDNENSHNASQVSWVSFRGFAPLTNSKYMVAETITDRFGEKSFRPWEGTVTFTYVRDSKKYGRVFLTGGLGVLGNNTIKTEKLKKVDVNTYRKLSGTDTLTLAQLESEEAYVGDYKSFMSGKLNAQLVYFFPKISWIGLSGKVEQFFGDYNLLNLQAGLPMVFTGKDKDSRVNVELQFKAFDVGNTIDEDKNFKDKFSIGLSVGLPFSSVIY